MPICNVTGVVYTPSGEPIGSTRVAFTPIERNITDWVIGAVVPKPVTTMSDAYGRIDVDLIPGSYKIAVQDWIGLANVPDSEIAYVSDLFAESPPPIPRPEWYDLIQNEIRDVEDLAEAANVAASTADDKATDAQRALSPPYQPFTSRADLVAYASVNTPEDGRTYNADGVLYIGQSGATEIADLPDLVPLGLPTPSHYSDAPDDADIDSAWADLGTIGAGEVYTYAKGFADTPDMAVTGPGTFKTTDGGIVYPRGKTFVAIKSRPSNTGSINTPTRAFDGDYKTPHTFQFVVSGEDTAGDPPFAATGEADFTTLFELSGFRTQAHFSSGKNVAPFTTGGRTAYNVDTRHLSHAGKAGAWHARYDVHMTGTDPDILMSRGQPASGILIGTVSTSVDNSIMQHFEFNLKDNGNPASGKSMTVNLFRNAADNGRDHHWWGMRFQSRGSNKVDAGFQLTGAWRNGLDLSGATIDRAIALAPGQGIYFNSQPGYNKGAPQWVTGENVSIGVYRYNNRAIYQAETAGTTGATPPTHLSGTASDGSVTWSFIAPQSFTSFAESDDGTRIYWHSASSSLRFTIGGSTRLTFSSNETRLLAGSGPFTLEDSNLRLISASANVQIGGVIVVKTRQTGWSAATGTANRTEFDTATVTTTQLAERVKALIDDLRTHGLIGA